MALMVELLPPFAKNVAGVNEQEIGVIFALESLGIVLFQLPVAKLVEGRRRMRTLALMGVIWAGSLLAVGAAWALALEPRLPARVRLTPGGVEPEGFGAGAAG